MKAKIRWVKDEELFECSKCHAEVEEYEEECWNCGAVFVDESKSSGAPKLIVKLLIGVIAAVLTFGILYFMRSNLLFKNQQPQVQQTQQVQSPADQPIEQTQEPADQSTEQQTQEQTQ